MIHSNPPLRVRREGERLGDTERHTGQQAHECQIGEGRAEVFGDDVVAAAPIDRLVHHAEVIFMKGDNYRLKDRDLGQVPPATKTND
jgi:hypothetical protein